MSTNRLSEDEKGVRLLAAAQRVGASRNDPDVSDDDRKGTEEAQTNWVLVQRFHRDDSVLFCRWTILALLYDYSRELAQLRDRSASIGRPTGSARNLSTYLIGDGLDISAVSGDIERYMPPSEYFEREHVQYLEDWGNLPEKFKPDRAPRQFATVTRERTVDRASRLSTDSTDLLNHLAAYSQLLQAAANTRLQRLVITLTALALAVAVISFVISLH